jgi:hydrogenase/urease accessory protein HupE
LLLAPILYFGCLLRIPLFSINPKDGMVEFMMHAQWFRRLSTLFLVTLSFFIAAPAFAHDMNMGGSKWYLGKNRIQSAIELDSSLFGQISGIKKGEEDLESLTDAQLRELTTGIIQPYINEKLSVFVNDQSYPIQVDRLERVGSFYKIWMNISDIRVDQPYKVKIDYKLLFEETSNKHVNIAFFYFSNKNEESVQSVFDHNEPDLQNTFEPDNTVREFSVEPKTLWSSINTFLLLGIKHILIGFDHIAFLVVLLVIGLPLREVIKIITSFTVAHSITLLLAALQIISLNARFIESVIALSICYIALENIFAKQVNYRWLAAFVFGLIHGFGFAGVLQEFIAGKSNLILSVVSFNVGVELGQLIIFFIMLPILHLLRNKFKTRRIIVGASAVIFIIGLIWLVERVTNLQLVPF